MDQRAQEWICAAQLRGRLDAKVNITEKYGDSGPEVNGIRSLCSKSGLVRAAKGRLVQGFDLLA
jgi:hypothetical protein